MMKSRKLNLKPGDVFYSNFLRTDCRIVHYNNDYDWSFTMVNSSSKSVIQMTHPPDLKSYGEKTINPPQVDEGTKHQLIKAVKKFSEAINSATEIFHKIFIK